MVMTHYMELLSLHEPWFLILFMLVPMVLAETILASGAFSLLYKDSRSEKWDSLSHVCGLILGVFFIVAGLLWMVGDSLGLGNFLAICPVIFPLPEGIHLFISPS